MVCHVLSELVRMRIEIENVFRVLAEMPILTLELAEYDVIGAIPGVKMLPYFLVNVDVVKVKL